MQIIISYMWLRGKIGKNMFITCTLYHSAHFESYTIVVFIVKKKLTRFCVIELTLCCLFHRLDGNATTQHITNSFRKKTRNF